VAELIVDTDILVDAGRGIQEAVEYLVRRSEGSTLLISAVSQMELLVGCRNKREQRKLERFLHRFETVKLNDAITDMAIRLLGRYRLSHGLLIPDALIAATALCRRAQLATINEKDYRFIKGLRLVSYP
jgi:predicted nucleic acid-binding protein